MRRSKSDRPLVVHARQSPPNLISQKANDFRRSSVPNLAYYRAASTTKYVVSGESLKKRRLVKREVPQDSVREAHHVLASRDAMDAGLKRFRGLIHDTPGVASILAATIDPIVVRMVKLASAESFGNR